MKADVQKVWQEDLTSGNFAQGHGYLRVWDPDNNVWEYCCLGVLCERSGLGTWEERTASNGDKVSAYLDSIMYLPPAVAEWAGLDPSTESETIQLRLAEMNDEETPFTEIAEKLPEVAAEFAEKGDTAS
jgi:hypothetical protein